MESRHIVRVLAIVASGLFLAGCDNIPARLQAAVLGLTSGSNTTTTVIVCPKLEQPPEPALVALERANDPAVDNWANELDQHYDQLDRCAR